MVVEGSHVQGIVGQTSAAIQLDQPMNIMFAVHKAAAAAVVSFFFHS